MGHVIDSSAMSKFVVVEDKEKKLYVNTDSISRMKITQTGALVYFLAKDDSTSLGKEATDELLRVLLDGTS